MHPLSHCDARQNWTRAPCFTSMTPRMHSSAPEMPEPQSLISNASSRTTCASVTRCFCLVYVVRLIVRQGLIQITVGIVLGLGAGFGLSRLMGNFLFGVEPGDPTVFGGVTVLIVAVGIFATWLPARRAGTVDPMVALRAE